MTAVKAPKLPKKSKTKSAKPFIAISAKNSSPLDDFYFKPKRKQINWRLLSTINIDDIVPNSDLIAFCIDKLILTHGIGSNAFFVGNLNPDCWFKINYLLQHTSYGTKVLTCP